jgi:hypothetical protein
MSDFKSSDRIRRAKHEKNYTVILNTTIQDSRLSWKARGLHHYILSLPDSWEICIAHLTEQSLVDGETTIKSALKELEIFGYLSKVRLKDDRGRFSKCIWDIYETPQVDFQLVDKSPKRKASKSSPQVDKPQVEKPQVDKPQVDKPQVDKPQVENHGLLNTYIQSTDLPSNDQQSTDKKNKSKLFVSDENLALFMPFIIVWNEFSPKHWEKYQKPNAAIVEKLKTFTKKYKSESLEIFQQGLQFLSADSFYNSAKINWTLRQYLTNEKPFNHACDYREKYQNQSPDQNRAAEFERLMNLTRTQP